MTISSILSKTQESDLVSFNSYILELVNESETITSIPKFFLRISRYNQGETGCTTKQVLSLMIFVIDSTLRHISELKNVHFSYSIDEVNE